jgi:hypothetical protein
MGCLSERVNSVKGTLKHRRRHSRQRPHLEPPAGVPSRSGRRTILPVRTVEPQLDRQAARRGARSTSRPRSESPAQRPGPVAILGRLTFRSVDSTRRSRSPWGPRNSDCGLSLPPESVVVRAQGIFASMTSRPWTTCFACRMPVRCVTTIQTDVATNRELTRGLGGHLEDRTQPALTGRERP